MKKIFKHILIIVTIASYLTFNNDLKAQTVVIPDVNFATYLQTIVPTAITGNLLDTTNVLVTTATQTINVHSKNIHNIYGVQFFKSLTYLDCSYNHISSLTSLPSTLKILCSTFNPLYNLPILPNSLLQITCEFDSLTTLPLLPVSLQLLSCGFNQITSIPTLPNTLTCLICYNNSLNSLPILPPLLKFLLCNNNKILSLPPLPNHLYQLACSNNKLTSLPNLPQTLGFLTCEHNQLYSLPNLPDSLIILACSNNNISCFPPFPINIQLFNISNNPFSCLPNYISAMDNVTRSIPLCNVGDNCPPSIDAPSDILIPNVFTPNNDGINDFFYVKSNNLFDFHCYIYNRWGILLYQYSDVNGSWNGNDKNQLSCVSGVYFYQITYVDKEQKTASKSGTIELIK